MKRLTILLLFPLALFAAFQLGRHTLYPLPTNGNTIVKDGEEGLERERRQAWLEAMHRAGPNTDWRQLEYQNRMRRHEKRARQAFFRSNCSTELVAEGLLQGYWQERGSNNQAGSIVSTTYDPIGNEIWAISAGGTLWRGGRLGLGWQPVNQDLQFDDGLLRFIPHADGRRLLAFTGRLPHYSDDEGLSWTAATGIQHSDRWGDFFCPLVLDDANHSFFVLAKDAYWSHIRLYRSVNDGEAFLPVSTFNTHEFQKLRLASPHHSKQMLLVEKAADGKGKIYTANAVTGQLLWSNEGTNLNFGKARANLTGTLWEGQLYLYAYTSPENGQWLLHRSMDGGTHWELVGPLPARPWEVGLYVSPSRPEVLYMGEVECYRSLDAGQNWEKINNWWDYYNNIEENLHADIMHFGEYQTSDGLPFLLVSHHGGITLSEDQLESQANIGLFGLNVSQYYSVRTDPNHPEYVYASSQDQGFQRSGQFGHPEAAAFEQVISGDYGHIAFSNYGNSLWTVYPGGWVTYYAQPRERGFTTAYDLVSEEEHVWLPPIIGSPYPGDNAIYMAGGNIEGGPGSFLIRLEAQGNNITASQAAFNFSDASAGGALSAIAASPQAPSHWYAATTNGRFFYSTDGGEEWQPSLNFIPEGHYLYGQAVYIFKNQPESVLLAGSGYSNPPVYLSTNGGQDFSAMGQGLPPTLVLDIDGNEDESLLFAATEAGPYVYIADHGRWFDMGECAPAQAYWSVEYLPEQRLVRFGTYGRGIWDFQIDEIVAAGSLGTSPLLVFPNPATHQIHVELPSGYWQVDLRNGSGQVVDRRSKQQGQATLDVSRLARGVYFLLIYSEKNRIIRKVLLR